jgi:hypothetical protein
MSELANQTSVFKDKTRNGYYGHPKSQMAESSTKSDMITKVIDDIFASGSINATTL